MRRNVVSFFSIKTPTYRLWGTIISKRCVESASISSQWVGFLSVMERVATFTPREWPGTWAAEA